MVKARLQARAQRTSMRHQRHALRGAEPQRALVQRQREVLLIPRQVKRRVQLARQVRQLQ